MTARASHACVGRCNSTAVTRGLLIVVDQTSGATRAGRAAYLPNYTRSSHGSVSSHANHSYVVLLARAQHNSTAALNCSVRAVPALLLLRLLLPLLARGIHTGGSCKSSAATSRTSRLRAKPRLSYRFTAARGRTAHFTESLSRDSRARTRAGICRRARAREKHRVAERSRGIAIHGRLSSGPTI